jgi:hypothetical protein
VGRRRGRIVERTKLGNTICIYGNVAIKPQYKFYMLIKTFKKNENM